MARKAERPEIPTPAERARTDPAYRALQEQRRRNLGDRLRQLRAEDDLDQADLAQLTGLHRSYIGQIEQGRINVSHDNLWALADALGFTPAEFFGED